MGLVAFVHMMAGTFAADAWLDDSAEWLYDIRIVLAVLVLTAAPVVALGFIGRLAFGKVRHLARTGGLAWALAVGVAGALTLGLTRAGESVPGDAVRLAPETFVALALEVFIAFLFAWALMFLGSFAASLPGRSGSRASRA